MIACASPLIGFDRPSALNFYHHVRQSMASKTNTSKSRGEKKQYVSAQQRKMRRQQTMMAIIGGIIVVAMIAAAVMQ